MPLCGPLCGTVETTLRRWNRQQADGSLLPKSAVLLRRVAIRASWDSGLCQSPCSKSWKPVVVLRADIRREQGGGSSPRRVAPAGARRCAAICFKCRLIAQLSVFVPYALAPIGWNVQVTRARRPFSLHASIRRRTPVFWKRKIVQKYSGLRRQRGALQGRVCAATGEGYGPHAGRQG